MILQLTDTETEFFSYLILFVLAWQGEMQQGTREQEEFLTKETLAIFSDMKIRYPGKTNEEADLIIEDVSSTEERCY